MTAKHHHYLKMTADAVRIIHHLQHLAFDKERENAQLIALGVVWLWDESTASSIASNAEAFKKDLDKQHMLAKIGHPALQDFADKLRDGYSPQAQTAEEKSADTNTNTNSTSNPNPPHSAGDTPPMAKVVPAAILKSIFNNQAPPFTLNEDGSVELSVYHAWLIAAGHEAFEALCAGSEIVTPRFKK